MQLAEDEIFEKSGQKCGNCNRNTLLPHEYVWTCISCGYDLIKRKRELSKMQRRKINLIIRIKHAEHKIFCNCIEVYKTYEGYDFGEIYELLSKLKNKKLKINNILIEKIKDMIQNYGFEQNFIPERQLVFLKLYMFLLE